QHVLGDARQKTELYFGCALCPSTPSAESCAALLPKRVIPRSCRGVSLRGCCLCRFRYGAARFPSREPSRQSAQIHRAADKRDPKLLPRNNENVGRHSTSGLNRHARASSIGKKSDG